MRNRHRQSIGNDVEELNILIEEILAYAELDQDNLVPKLEPINLKLWLKNYVDQYKSSKDEITISLAPVEQSKARWLMPG